MNKSILFTFELAPGMITARDVYTVTGQLLIPADTILDTNAITRLQLYNIASVSVWENAGEEAASSEDDESTYFNKIRASEEFKLFESAYSENVDSFKHTINDIVTKNEPINTPVLIERTASLLTLTSSGLALFDMLQNMRNFDDSTFTHSMNVALICGVLGKWLRLPYEDRDILILSGLLHDIGKLSTPETILTKPARLTPDEYTIMKEHSTAGYNILRDQNIDPRIKEACLFHHERCDGTGYPYGLTGSQIPDFAKIVAIADVYDAMTAKRVYRGPMCPFTVIRFIEDEGYNQFDPKFLLVFLEHVVGSYINTTIRLNNNETGKVVYINKSSLSRPVIQTDTGFIDLSGHPELEIEAII